MYETPKIVEFYKLNSISTLSLLMIKFRLTMTALVIFSLIMMYYSLFSNWAFLLTPVPALFILILGSQLAKSELRDRFGIASDRLPNWEPYKIERERRIRQYVVENGINVDNMIKYIEKYCEYSKIDIKTYLAVPFIVGIISFISKDAVEKSAAFSNLLGSKTYLIYCLLLFIVWMSAVMARLIINDMDLRDISKSKNVVLILMKINSAHQVDAPEPAAPAR